MIKSRWFSISFFKNHLLFHQFLLQLQKKFRSVSQSEMRGDNISIQQTSLMMKKFFSSSFSLLEVIQGFRQKRTKQSVIENLKKTLKNTLINIQSQLCSSKQIKTLRIYDSINSCSKMYDSLLNISDILTEELSNDLEVYYNYQSQFLIRSRFKPIETPMEPVTSKKKKQIYDKFIEYFDKNNLFEVDLKEENIKKEENSGEFKFEDFTNQYSMGQVDKIYQLYERNKGDMELLSIKLCQSGMGEQKASKQNIRKVLLFFLTTGIAKIYKLSNNLDKFSGCSWDKFQKVHKTLMRSFSYEEKKLLLKLGISDSVANSFVMKMCDRMGLRYKPIGYPKWIKTQNSMGLYQEEKNAVMDKIKGQLKNLTKVEGKKIKFVQKNPKQNQDSIDGH